MHLGDDGVCVCVVTVCVMYASESQAGTGMSWRAGQHTPLTAIEVHAMKQNVNKGPNVDWECFLCAHMSARGGGGRRGGLQQPAAALSVGALCVRTQHSKSTATQRFRLTMDYECLSDAPAPAVPS
jgi:hypothetical protein